MYMLNASVWCIFAIPSGYGSFRRGGGGGGGGGGAPPWTPSLRPLDPSPLRSSNALGGGGGLLPPSCGVFGTPRMMGIIGPQTPQYVRLRVGGWGIPLRLDPNDDHLPDAIRSLAAGRAGQGKGVAYSLVDLEDDKLNLKYLVGCVIEAKGEVSPCLAPLGPFAAASTPDPSPQNAYIYSLGTPSSFGEGVTCPPWRVSMARAS